MVTTDYYRTHTSRLTA